MKNECWTTVLGVEKSLPVVFIYNKNMWYVKRIVIKVYSKKILMKLFFKVGEMLVSLFSPNDKCLD